MRSEPTVQNRSSAAQRVHRRQWLRAAAAAAGGTLLLSDRGAVVAADERLKTLAKKNLKLGVHTWPYAKLPLDEAARRMREEGFSAVLTEYTFADVRFDPLAPDWKAADRIVATFARNGIEIVAVFGYVNVVDPVPERRQRGEAKMDCLIANWKRLGCRNISTETGTFNAKSDWLEAPENATEEGFRKCREAFKVLAGKAEKAGAVVSIEPYWRNIIDSAEHAERLFREVDSPALRLVMDPCNYPRKEDLPRLNPLMDDVFKRLGDKIVVAHAKDVKAAADGTDLPAAGRGVLDYSHYLRLLAGLNRELPLLVEHVELDDVPRAREYVRGQFEKL